MHVCLAYVYKRLKPTSPCVYLQATNPTMVVVRCYMVTKYVFSLSQLGKITFLLEIHTLKLIVRCKVCSRGSSGVHYAEPKRLGGPQRLNCLETSRDDCVVVRDLKNLANFGFVELC